MPKWYGESALSPDNLIPPEQQWKIQWARFKRWYERASEIKNKSINEPLSLHDIDILIACLQNCYHIRDWIELSQPKLKESIKNFFQSNLELQGCRDVCHGFKHKKLSKPSIDPDFNLFREYDHFGGGKNPESYYLAFWYENNIRKYNIFEFIDKCYSIWEEFIKKNKLLC